MEALIYEQLIPPYHIKGSLYCSDFQMVCWCVVFLCLSNSINEQKE